MAWIQHIKDTQRKHGCSYKEAMGLASGTYKKGTPSKTRPGHEDFMAHMGSRSKTHRGLDYEGDEEGMGLRDNIRSRVRSRVGGAVGDIPIVPSNIASFGNTNLGVMNVPQAHIPYQVVNASGQTRRPKLRMRGGGVIDELGTQNYIGQIYNQRELGANGVVRL
jgi:hypothetical protein